MTSIAGRPANRAQPVVNISKKLPMTLVTPLANMCVLPSLRNAVSVIAQLLRDDKWPTLPKNRD